MGCGRVGLFRPPSCRPKICPASPREANSPTQTERRVYRLVVAAKGDEGDAQPSARAVRLGILYERLDASERPTDAEAAYRQLCELLEEVEDEYSGVIRNPCPGLEPDGRMYPPRPDRIERSADGSIVAVTRRHEVRVAPSGALTILDAATSAVVYERR